MIKFEHFAFTKRYWGFYKTSVISWSFVFDICKWLGGFWLIIEPLSYFSEKFGNLVKPLGLYIFGVSVLFAIILKSPRLKFKYFIEDKDVYVNIVIGDLLKNKKKDIIIPTNVHFVTELSDNLISEKSVQGQFTRMYYTSYRHLDSDIESSVTTANYTVETPLYLGKDKRYDLGTVARLSIKKDNKRLFWTYLFALAKLNEHGVCQSNIGEFQKTLPSLWSYIQNKGELSDLSLPILGSGFCRIDSSREDLFKEILLSFLAATRNSKFCKSLTFVLYYKDVAEMNIDIESIKEFTRFQTSNFSRESNRNNAVQQGQAIN